MGSFAWMKTLVVVSVIALLGCARPSVMDRSAMHPGYKIGAAKVVWIDDPALQWQVQKKGYGISPLTPRDYYVARMELGPIFDLFRCEAPSMIAARVAEKIVLGGEEVIIELKPESGRHLIDWENSIVVRATVKGRADGSLQTWYATVRATGKVEDPPRILLENYTEALMTELQAVGWF